MYLYDQSSSRPPDVKRRVAMFEGDEIIFDGQFASDRVKIKLFFQAALQYMFERAGCRHVWGRWKPFFRGTHPKTTTVRPTMSLTFSWNGHFLIFLLLINQSETFSWLLWITNGYKEISSTINDIKYLEEISVREIVRQVVNPLQDLKAVASKSDGYIIRLLKTYTPDFRQSNHVIFIVGVSEGQH